ncbi:MAG: hypothetical protein FJX71_04870 [Alphaproteobacteria bacterium]|nr:hypothetical protein [Alphaproteobacteria bacterium]
MVDPEIQEHLTSIGINVSQWSMKELPFRNDYASNIDWNESMVVGHLLRVRMNTLSSEDEVRSFLQHFPLLFSSPRIRYNPMFKEFFLEKCVAYTERGFLLREDNACERKVDGLREGSHG